MQARVSGNSGATYLQSRALVPRGWANAVKIDRDGKLIGASVSK